MYYTQPSLVSPNNDTSLATGYKRVVKGRKRNMEADIVMFPHERTCIHIIIALTFTTFERPCEVKFENDFSGGMTCQNKSLGSIDFFLKDLHFCKPHKTIPPRANPEIKIRERYGHPPKLGPVLLGICSILAVFCYSRRLGVLIGAAALIAASTY